MNIALLIIHILCAVLNGINAIIGKTMLTRVCAVICVGLWSICIGLDIAKF